MNNCNIINDLYHACTKGETYLNVAACFPIIGIYSGQARMKMAKMQLKVGLAFGVLGIAFSLAGCKNWDNVAYLGGKFILHGALNVIRGFGEQGVGESIIGRQFLVLFNLVPGFGPWISYYDYENKIPLDFTRRGF